MSGSIFQGFEEQINQTTEDILPYYYLNYSKKGYENYLKDYDDYYNHHEDPTESYLFLCVIFLGLLTFICFIIMIVLCIKCCCSTSHEDRVFAQNFGSSQVPPPFIYITPFLQQSQSQGGGVPTSQMLPVTQGAFLQTQRPANYIEWIHTEHKCVLFPMTAIKKKHI